MGLWGSQFAYHLKRVHFSVHSSFVLSHACAQLVKYFRHQMRLAKILLGCPGPSSHTLTQKWRTHYWVYESMASRSTIRKNRLGNLDFFCHVIANWAVANLTSPLPLIQTVAHNDAIKGHATGLMWLRGFWYLIQVTPMIQLRSICQGHERPTYLISWPAGRGTARALPLFFFLDRQHCYLPSLPQIETFYPGGKEHNAKKKYNSPRCELRRIQQ